MIHSSDADIPARRSVLHALRCAGVLSFDRVVTFVGADHDQVRAVLHQLEEQRLVSFDDGPFGGWAITAGGRGLDAEWTRGEMTDAAARAAVTSAYAGFEPLNERLLEICHAWQMRSIGGTPLMNDHRDPDYDMAVIDRLSRVHRSAQRLLDPLTVEVRRFSTYARRLDEAMARVDAGDVVYFTDGVDSYHSVWFQLHEDLLATLGIERFRGS